MSPEKQAEALDRVSEQELQRAHESQERASALVPKILVAVHGGLAIGLASWLEREFTATGEYHLLPYLVFAFFAVAVGLITATLAPVIDSWTATLVAKAAESGRSIAAHLEANPQNKEAMKNEIKIIRADGKEKDRAAKWWNATSTIATVVSWACLLAAATIVCSGLASQLL